MSEVTPQAGELADAGRKLFSEAVEGGAVPASEAPTDDGPAPKLGGPTDTQSARRREQQRITAQAITKFNMKAKHCLKFLREHGMIDETPEAFAAWMYAHREDGLSKRKMGEFLGGIADYNQRVLESFLEAFDFHGHPLDGAIRILLRVFRLPGESQCIDRIMEKFASTFKAANEDTWAFSEDAAYVLAFSIIMLNTDLHNASIADSKRMTLEGFIGNNREIDEGKDLPPEVLEQMYNSIKSEEIKMDEGDLYESELVTFAGAKIAGWLEKGGTHVYSSWHKYWFVLSSDGVLYYFNSPADADSANPRCILSNLETLEVKPFNKSGNRDFVLVPASDGGILKSVKKDKDGRLEPGHHSELLMRAKTNEDRQRWMTTIDVEIKRLRAGGPAVQMSSLLPSSSSTKSRSSLSSQTTMRSSSSGSRPATLGAPVRQGWGQKRGDFNRAWRRRYFALYRDSRSGEGVLAYYGSKEACEREVERGETTAKGVIMFSKMAAIREEHEALEATRVLAVATLDRTWVIALPESAWPSWVLAFNSALTDSGVPLRVEECGRVWSRGAT